MTESVSYRTIRAIPEGGAADLELAQGAASGDEGAQRELTERLLTRVRTTIRYLCGDHPDTLDIVQLCLVEILRSVRTFKGESRLETWSDRIAVRTAMRLLKKGRGRPETLFDVVPEPQGVEERISPEGALGKSRVRARMAHLLGKLNPERRTVLMLQIVYGYSAPEIAELTESGIHTVRDRIKIGKQQLRKLILTDPTLREWAATRAP